jgi:hypothetical protein
MSSVTQSRRFNRRTIATGSLAGAVALFGTRFGQANAQIGTPEATPIDESTPDHAAKEFLAVADPAARHLYVYSLLDLTLIDTIGDVVVNSHAGFIPLPNGQVLFMDDANSRLMAIEVHGDHLHSHEAAIPGTVFSHIAIDSDHAHYAAVGSDDPDAPITLVDLETWETTPVAILAPGEVGLFLTHDVLFHRNNNLNQIEAYAIEAVLAGTVEILATVQIGAGGHGESLTMNGDTLYTATDDGIDAVAWDGEEFTFLTTYQWESADRMGGRGYFQRLSLDGSKLVSYTANREAPETEWTTWTNDAVLIDTDEGVTNRIDLGTGYVYRFGLSLATALFYRLGGDGDEAIVLDLASGEVTTRISLEPMTRGPVAGESIHENNQYRAVTSTTDGTRGFVTEGGDGKVVVLDLVSGTIAGSIVTESPLNGGGYLTVFGAPESFSDTIGR